MAIKQLDPSTLAKEWWVIVTNDNGGSLLQSELRPDENQDIVFPEGEDGEIPAPYTAGTFKILPGPLSLIEAFEVLKRALHEIEYHKKNADVLLQDAEKAAEDVVQKLEVVETTDGSKVDFESKTFWAVVCEDLGGSVIQNPERPPEDEDIIFPMGSDSSIPAPYKAGKFKVVAGPLTFKEAFIVLKDFLSYPQELWDQAMTNYTNRQIAQAEAYNAKNTPPNQFIILL